MKYINCKTLFLLISFASFGLNANSKESDTCLVNGACETFEDKDIVSIFSDDQKTFKLHARKILKQNKLKRKTKTKSQYVANKLLKSILDDQYKMGDLQGACKKYKGEMRRKKGKCSISYLAKVSVVKRKLRLLHVAIIMNNEDAVHDFIENTSDQNSLSLKDRPKWSIAHFAAISSESREMLDILLEKYPILRSFRNT